MATTSFAAPCSTSRDLTDGCMFVSRVSSSVYDDELLEDVEEEVFRSTPSFAPQFVVAPSSVSSMEQDDQFNASMDYDTEYGANSVTEATFRDSTSTSYFVRKVEFSSIADDVPLSTTSKSSVGQLHQSTSIYRPCAVQAAQVTNSNGNYISNTGKITPLLNPIQEDTQLDDQTVLNRSKTIERESDDRQSPFGKIIVQTPTAYQYLATKTEEDEMEHIRWEVQHTVFQRYYDLTQREPQWGSIDVRDGRIFFHPGKRRAAVMREKNFHDTTYKEGVADGDVSWYEPRHAQFTAVYREFLRGETKHKQELMLSRLEKSSPFSKFPTLGKRFILLQLLGKGGNGEVWNVIDYADNQHNCALKLSTSLKHAQREHLTHSRLKHENIVAVGDTAYSIEYRQQFYTAFTVESVKTDLQQLIEMYEYFDESLALKVLFQLLNALTYLHGEMKIAHYDLKPSNILITEDECVKLTDFDLARHINEPIASSSVGTLRYLPPECYRPNFGDCEGTAEKADIWMVGIVYCLMLWGKHPICHDKTSHEEAKATLARYNGQITYVRQVSDLSRWIIHGCLHPDPRCRPTAFQLHQSLQATMQQQL